MNKAKQILQLIDLTNLSESCTKQDIKNLHKQAKTNFGNVACLCVWQQFVPVAKSLAGDLPIASVINFPNGEDAFEKIINDINEATKNGATEIDLVHNYNSFIKGNETELKNLIKLARGATDKNFKLKLILETGKLTKPQIEKASKIAIESGVDFLKTSTGKTETGATIEAAKIMLNEIKKSKKQTGIKISGGIKTIIQATEYIELAKNIMGENYTTKKTFRIGASSLLADVMEALPH